MGYPDRRAEFGWPETAEEVSRLTIPNPLAIIRRAVDARRASTGNPSHEFVLLLRKDHFRALVQHDVFTFFAELRPPSSGPIYRPFTPAELAELLGIKAVSVHDSPLRRVFGIYRDCDAFNAREFDLIEAQEDLEKRSAWECRPVLPIPPITASLTADDDAWLLGLGIGPE